MTAVEFLQAQFDKHLYYVEGYYNAKPYTLQDLVNDFDTALTMERTATCKEEQLQQRIEQLQKEYDWACGEINKWRENAEEWAARCQELEEQLRLCNIDQVNTEADAQRFAEWASGEGWEYVEGNGCGIWFQYDPYDNLPNNEKTTSELLAEWDRCGSI